MSIVVRMEGQSSTGPASEVVAVAEPELRPMLVPAAEAARLLSVGRTTLYEVVKRGELTPIHIGRCVRFSVAELAEFVDRHHRAA